MKIQGTGGKGRVLTAAHHFVVGLQIGTPGFPPIQLTSHTDRERVFHFPGP